jgi:ribosomal protein S9
MELGTFKPRDDANGADDGRPTNIEIATRWLDTVSINGCPRTATEAIAMAQVHALLAIAEQLRDINAWVDIRGGGGNDR